MRKKFTFLSIKYQKKLKINKEKRTKKRIKIYTN